MSEYIDKITRTELVEILKNIGAIPESIAHDSTEEKIYSKVSDMILAKALHFMGLRSKAVVERSDSADILAESVAGFGYSLVADAKCFRLSRTAKNQKDFKISSLSDWRGSEHEYAVLVAPYFQYPNTQSQIYSTSLDREVCLLSWEHIAILVENDINENENFSLESIWNSTKMIARDKSLAFANRKQCFLDKINLVIANKLGISLAELKNGIHNLKVHAIERCSNEIQFWKNAIVEIESYDRERAINELIVARKIKEKISAISTYKKQLERDYE